MLKSILLAAAIGLLAFIAFNVQATTAVASERGLDDHEALEKCMKEMKSTMRRLRKTIEDKAEKAKSLESIESLQSNIVTAKGLVPGVVAKSDKKAEMGALYREKMLECLEQTIALERAVVADKLEDAKTALKALYELQDTGHAKFKVDDH